MSRSGLPKSRLGRGLSSLMNSATPVAEVSQSEDAGVGGAAAARPLPSGVVMLELRVDDMVPNPHQPRRQFDDTSLRELADSIRSTGLIQPVVARGTAEGGYELIAGERRWRAAKLAGLATVPVILRSVDPVMQAQMALIENIQRQDLNPIDRAAAYKALLENLGLTQAELADRLGEDRSVIGHYLRLLDLTSAVQAMVADGRLSVGHAKVLAGVADPAEQTRLAELAVAQGLNIRNLERVLSGAGSGGGPERTPPAASAHLADLEKTLSRQIGIRVQVRSAGQKGKGRLILHYGSLDQFDELMTRLGVAVE